MCRDCRVHVCGSARAVVCRMCPWGERTWVRCPLSAPKPLVTSSRIQQETLSLAQSPHTLGGFLPEVLRSHWDRPRQCPKKPCWAPARAYPKCRSQGGGDLPAPEAPVPLTPVCILQVFHFSGFMLLFQRETCVFSVRFQ